MKIYPHFSVVGFCNTYVVGPDGGGDSIIIDPGHVDSPRVSLLCQARFTPKAVLLTHTHSAHSQGLGTLEKVYEHLDIYAGSTHGLNEEHLVVEDGHSYQIAGFTVKAMHIPGHSIDSMVYVIGHAIFTGDTLEASLVAHTSGYLEHELLTASIKQRLTSMDTNYLVFPGHGTISKIGIERLFNEDLNELDNLKFWSADRSNTV